MRAYAGKAAPEMSSGTPLVSAIIPAYNQAHYLADAITSVSRQTFDGYEIIVVDDGSTDETPLVAQRFGKLIRYIRQSNQGLAGARNTGIQQAWGEYIALLDCDDQWLPTFLQDMLVFAEQNPQADIYYSGWRYMDADSHDLPQAACTRVFLPETMYAEMLRTNVLNVCSVLLRRSVVIEAGLFDVSFRRLEDWELWLRLLRAGRTFVGLPKSLVRYRLHASSLSRDPASMQQAALDVAVKLFGPDDGHWQVWPAEKRRIFGGVYRYHAISSVEYQGNWVQAAVSLRKALQVDPTLAMDFDLFYELALGAQPKGYRGTSQKLALLPNLLQTRAMLKKIFHPPVPRGLITVRSEALGTAYQAMGVLAYHRGYLAISRHHLLQAVRHRPVLAFQRQMFSYLGKSLIGRKVLNRLRPLKNGLKGS